MTYTISDIVKDPLGAYREMHDRLLAHGPNASFPEFKPAVDAIIDAITSERFSEVFEEHPDLLMEKHEVMTMLTHVNLTFVFDDPEGIHPYQIPFSDPFPYRPTLEVIDAGLRLLDKLNRFEPGNRAVPFYHFDRYAYHKFGIFGDPDTIVMPVAQELGFYDLVRVRSVPIGFVGVVTETIRVDRHWQSPLDFWYHDINHVRRMSEFFRLRIKEQGIKGSPEEIFTYYQQMDAFLAEKIAPFVVTTNKMSEAEIALRRMVQILVFEVVHESALTAEPHVIFREIMRASGPQPFEHMIAGEKKTLDMEQFRTPTGNIASGASVVEADPRETLVVRYFFDRSLGLLSTIFNKLNFGFYDDPEYPSDSVVPVKYRTQEVLLDAVFKLFELCDIASSELPSRERVLELIADRQGSHEKYVYKGVLVNEGENEKVGSYATDPLPVKEVIKEIYRLGKKILLFSGYSELGYENPKVFDAVVREKLSKLDPAEYAVCIGATEEGIGKAYGVAKEMGFETIGIVSTLALSSIGHFSKDCDRIYIVNDDQWGGYIPGTDHAAPTTRAFLESADILCAIGGGLNTAALLEIATIQYPDLKISFTPADMDHDKAKRRRITDFAGPASKVSLARKIVPKKKS